MPNAERGSKPESQKLWQAFGQTGTPLGFGFRILDSMLHGSFAIRHSSSLALFVLLGVFCPQPSAFAVIPEPDNILYGTLALDSQPVTATRTDVVVEARRSLDGPAVARYRMGSDSSARNFYRLRLALESLAPVNDPSASSSGENLVIVVTDASGVRAQTNYALGGPGTVQRVDFGVAVPDADADGLPDAWELSHFPGLAQSGGTLGANGQTLLEHFIAGTDPNDPKSGFRLTITQDSGQKTISFLARRAEGPGYDGMTRLYSLETAADPAPSSWTGVPSVTGVAGNNQTVVYQTPGGAGPEFIRGRIELLGFGASPGDSDADGLPDAWETLHFGSLNRDADSVGLNGQTALQSYTTGTDPNDPNSTFKLIIALNNNQRTVSFLAREAAGVGYENRTRLFTLESSTTLEATSWTTVSGWSDVLGTNQVVTYVAPQSGTPVFYRTRVRLTP